MVKASNVHLFYTADIYAFYSYKLVNSLQLIKTVGTFLQHFFPL